MTGEIVRLLAVSLGVTMAAMVSLWALSVRRGDPSFVDAWWPMGFVVVAWVSVAVAGEGRLALAIATSVWGVRLGVYLFWRWRRNGPDKRYVNMVRHAPGNPHAFTLKNVFLLQGALLWVVSLPLQIGPLYGRGLSPLNLVGLGLCALGIGFETIGDAQLTRFKADATNAGKVMDTGLWRYTRHPNYFGDACFWWGIWLAAHVNAVTAVTIVGPAVMTFLLAKWSGVGPLERRLKRHKPEYAAYMARTSGFVPLPPRSAR